MIQKNPNPYWFLEKIPLASLMTTLAVVFPGTLFFTGKTIALFAMKGLYYIFYYSSYYGVYYGLKSIASIIYFLASHIIIAIITTIVLIVLYLVRRKK